MTDAPFLAETRDSYSAMAASYGEMVAGELERRPLDRALLGVFAELVKAGGGGPVADVGCGSGRVTVVLQRLGLDAFGIDLAPGMVELARRSYPELRFEVGSMLALDLPDGGLGGLLAHYSIIHVPWEHRPAVFAEFYRVLAPGGQLMLSFQVGDERLHRDEAWGIPISVDWYRQRPDEVAGLLRAAGFDVWMTAVRESDGTEKAPQGYLIARKSSVRPFAEGDAARVAAIIQRCLREVNSRDYAADVIERMCAHYTAERMVELARQREIFVYEQGGAVVGTASREGNKVFTMFVDPAAGGRGVGRALLSHLEARAAAEGHDQMETGASITAHDFYRRLGYVDVRESQTEFGLNYILRKQI